MPRLLIAWSLWLLLAAPAWAQSLKVLTTGAFKQVVVVLAERHTQRTGQRIEVLNDTAGALVRRVDGGETFDVLFLTPGGLQGLAAKGRIDAASIRPVARVAIGVAVKAGAPLPALATVEDFKAALLAARRVTYIDPAAGGSSGIYLDGLFQRLGVAEQVRAKAVLVPGGLVAERIVRGEADLALHQVSEILPVAGVALVGLLPEAIQNRTTYGVGLPAGGAQAAAARAFVATLAEADVAELLRTKGMEPVR